MNLFFFNKVNNYLTLQTIYYVKFGFIKRVDKGEITTVKADVSSVSPSSERIEELWVVVIYMRV